ncbi:ribonuclease D [Catenovulum sp. SM1970]|uniref:ribonuclease D n=1 Tax=Marinifaba aquimaris TaxID=2741323 RepID=UPI001573A01E|nr:ribonuclease D [Marinifaba aquimaris]NTS77653.1 ribonuclease D [Marinifaba aquimaris]
MSYILIENQVELDKLADHLIYQAAIAIDTEFVRQRTYFPKLGLIQINCGQNIYLIDPVNIQNWQSLVNVLISQDVVKVIHSCSEDIEVFKTAMDCKVENFFDTQVAEAHLNQGNSLGLAVLVKRYHDIEMDKGQARTDWLQRPLSDQQLAYAADDVRYLLPIYQRQAEQLGDEGLARVTQDVDLIVDKKHTDVVPALAWRDIKCNWQMTPRQLTILKELVEWRLGNAINRDMAVNFVVNERSLVLLAERAPTSLNSMKHIPGIHPMEVKKHGKALLECILRGKAVEQKDCLPRVPRLAESPRYKALFAELKKVIQKLAIEHDVSVELLATKRMINQYIAYKWDFYPWVKETMPELLLGWRKDIVEDALSTVMDSYRD